MIALEAGNLARDETEHRKIAKRPECMAAWMLTMGRWGFLRRRALGAFAARPATFARLPAMHVGGLPPMDFAAAGLSLGWHMLTL